MKKYAVLLLLTLFTHESFANSFYNQLCDFNYNWLKYENRIIDTDAKLFNSDVDYIQSHLGEVILILKANPTNYLNSEEKASRFNLIRALEVYCQKGIFPVNKYRKERTPVFIDEYNTHCAVGHLLEKTGREKLAQRIANANNYAWVKEITNPELLVWQKQSGLSLEELKLIQGAYDFYPMLNLHDPNKYEIPQKPEFMTLFFDKNESNKTEKKKIWCKGEGLNGILHGRWEQNYSEKLPWIVGFFNKGKRTGQWKEYYQGTNKLCRTENWRNNKLNGVRKRFNKAGLIIEEILFKNGRAITKTNYDLNGSLKFIRTPLDSNIVWTEVYTTGGSILAYGKEKVHNPGNLMWFQNIELTALNTAAITSRDLQKTNSFRGGNQPIYMNPESGTGLYNAPPLVEYKKEGEWVYYKDYNIEEVKTFESKFHNMIYIHYTLLEVEMRPYFIGIENQKIIEDYDSIVIHYVNNNITDFIGFSENQYLHFIFKFQHGLIPTFIMNYSQYSRRMWDSNSYTQDIRMKMVGQYNKNKERIGRWIYYDFNQNIIRTDSYITPWKEEKSENLVITAN